MEVEQEWFQQWSMISVRCYIKNKWLGGRDGKREKSIIWCRSWSQNNKSAVFGKTDAQTDKTIDHIKGKKIKKKKTNQPTNRFCLKPFSSITCKKATKWADQNGGLRSDQPQRKKQRNRVTLISLYSFAEAYLKNYGFIVYVSHFPLNQSVCQTVNTCNIHWSESAFLLFTNVLEKPLAFQFAEPVN